MFLRCLLATFFFVTLIFGDEVKVGADVLFEEIEYHHLIVGKKIGLISNQTGINKKLETTFQKLKNQENLAALFTPEHGFYGEGYACENIEDGELQGIPLHSLHGSRRRPTKEMLDCVDVLIFDMQDIGSRSYTFVSTLFFCMEAAAAQKIPLIVLDRPNPMGGIVVDGPSVEEKWRSILGYIAVPYCHGMTVGELATLFNAEYQIGCQLTVVPMRGWKRGMTFQECNLPWVPTSPQIPEADSPFFYSTTGIIGHCSLTSIGVGYTLPFKLIGAPWIDAEAFSQILNQQKLPGVLFHPFYYKPFFGKFKGETCQGVKVIITDANSFLPMTTQFTIMGMIKTLYPKYFNEMLQNLQSSKSKFDVFHKLVGSEEIFQVLSQEPYVTWKLREICATAKENFLPIRKKYLIY